MGELGSQGGVAVSTQRVVPGGNYHPRGEGRTRGGGGAGRAQDPGPPGASWSLAGWDLEHRGYAAAAGGLTEEEYSCFPPHTLL